MTYPAQRRLFSPLILASLLPAAAAPVIDPIPNASVPAGRSIIIPVTATSTNGRPLTYTATSSTNRISVEVHTNNPFWRMTVVQVAPSNAPGAFATPFRGGVATVTNIGEMTFMLFKDIAPHTVDVISGLTFGGFYNSNTIFHRVIPGFVIQGGDPDTNGTGGPVFRYEDEVHPRALFAGNGQLALANSGRDTDGSQFFVTFGPQRGLDLGFTLFGQMLRGYNVASNIVNTPRNTTNGTDRPFAEVIITRAAIVTNTTDTVLTLTGTNLANVSGTIKVVADDGAGGKTTNSFTATTVADSVNAPTVLYPLDTVTNRIGAVNARLTNTVPAFDFEGSTYYWYYLNYDDNATNSIITVTNGQLKMVIVPNTGFVGEVGYQVVVSASPDWLFYYQLFPPDQWPAYDWQPYFFAFGDTKISAFASNFTATAGVAFTNQLLATFTNGVANSSPTNFTASINWGDNSITAGVIVTNVSGRKEIRGAHTYTNPGNFPVYISINSRLGADATVIATATVPPALKLTRAATNNTVTWPSWAGEYQLQTHTNLSTANWSVATNTPVLNGYDFVVTNSGATSNLFWRLKK